MKFRQLTTIIAVLVVSQASAIAGTIQYFYQGPSLPATAGVQDAVTAVSGSFTVELGPDLASFGNSPMSQFSFSDGMTTYDSTTHNVVQSIFFTDRNSRVTSFAISLEPIGPVVIGDALAIDIVLDPAQVIGTGTATSVNYCTGRVSEGGCLEQGLRESVVPGTLSISMFVPQPTILVVLAIVLAWLGFTLRKSS